MGHERAAFCYRALRGFNIGNKHIEVFLEAARLLDGQRADSVRVGIYSYSLLDVDDIRADHIGHMAPAEPPLHGRPGVFVQQIVEDRHFIHLHT